MVLHNILKRDHAYLVVVFLSIIAGDFTRKLHDPRLKRNLSAAIGFLIAVLFCGWEMSHLMISTCVGTLIMKTLQRGFMPRIVFGFSFLYRLFFCLLTYGSAWRNENTLANGIQLIAMIKMISVAYEIAEYRKSRSVHSNGIPNGNSVLNDPSNHKSLHLLEEPSTSDIVCYMYCFLGLSTGPFFRYRTYHDMLHMPKHVSDSIPVMGMILSRLPIFIVLVMLSTALGDYFPSEYMKSDDFYEDSLLYRFCYVIPIGFVGMSRYGVVWFLSEFSFTAAGLGVYPEAKKSQPGRGPSIFSENDQIWSMKENPKPVKYDCEAITNIYIVEGFTSETYGKTFRYWNCTVQWWLAHYIYASRILSGKHALIKWIAVGVVSAVWHGFRAGYYFAFVGMVYITFAEKLLLSEVTCGLTGFPKTIADVLHYFLFKVIGIGSFMTMFVLSSYEDILRYLTSVYFGIYSIATVSILLAAASSVLSKRKANFVAKVKPE